MNRGPCALCIPGLLLYILHHQDFELRKEIDIIVVLRLSEWLVGMTRVLIHVTKPDIFERVWNSVLNKIFVLT